MLIVRYEDIVSDGTTLRNIFEHFGVDNVPQNKKVDSSAMHGNSIQKWKMDKNFGFQLD